MQHLDDGMIHAWLDGELPPAEAEQIEAHTRECAECAQRVAEARGLIAASTRILTALDNVPSGVVPAATIPIAPARRRRWYDRTDLRAAAAVLFIAGASLVALRAGRSKNASLETIARTESSPLASAVILDSALPTTAEASKVTETPHAKPKPEARRMAESPPAVSLKTVPSTSNAFGSMRATDEVASSKVAEARAAVQSATAAAPPQVMQRIAGVAARKSAANEPRALAGVVGGVAGSEAVGLGRVEGHVADTAGKAVASASLRVLSTDSTAAARHVVYEVSPGIQVTLADSLTSVAAEKDLKLRDKTVAAPAPAIAPTAVMTTAKSPINTISWSDGNHHYTLSGSLSVRELEAIKPRIIKMRR